VKQRAWLRAAGPRRPSCTCGFGSVTVGRPRRTRLPQVPKEKRTLGARANGRGDVQDSSAAARTQAVRFIGALAGGGTRVSNRASNRGRSRRGGSRNGNRRARSGGQREERKKGKRKISSSPAEKTRASLATTPRLLWRNQLRANSTGARRADGSEVVASLLSHPMDVNPRI